MMASWMIHAVAAAAVLGTVGFVAERGLSLLGRPVRWAWLFVMLASVVWPFVSAALRIDGSLAVGATAAAGASAAAAGDGVIGRIIPASLPGGTPTSLLLLGAWLSASTLLVLMLLLLSSVLSVDRRRWGKRSVAGEGVFVSDTLGPAVVGVFRPCIVLPGWVLEMDARLQRLIVLHEREHVRAGDSRLLMAGLLLLVLLPWCLPLWWHLHRLRLAIEMDCDTRLLRSGASARAYAEVLLAVARRRRRPALALPGLGPSMAALERRLRLIAAGPPRGRTGMGFALLAAAALLLPIGAAAVPLPGPPSPSSLQTQLLLWWAADESVRPDGSLRGDPGQERLDAEIRTHHSAAIAAGLPPRSVIWFVADRSGAVAHTGIEQGSLREVEEDLLRRFPAETSGGFALGWDGVPAAGEAEVLWLLPEP